MPNLSGEEIKDALRMFVTRWKDYSGTERSEAQTFLKELFDAYSDPISLCQFSEADRGL